MLKLTDPGFDCERRGSFGKSCLYEEDARVRGQMEKVDLRKLCTGYKARWYYTMASITKKQGQGHG
jgi:hypothetical protein